MKNFFKKRITITGGQGFLGQVIKRKLEERGCKKISIVKHKKYDLVKMKDVEKMYKDQRPDIVFHLAATVGGIGINKKKPKILLRKCNDESSSSSSRLFKQC